MVNIHIKDLSIELTRWCQQQCMHCMRGPRENLFISEKIIDRFFYNPDYRIKYINFLLLTGGEPTLAAKQLKYLIDALEEQNVIVNTYRVVTNGLDYPEEFFDQLKRLDIRNDYIKSNSLVISTDQFHKKPSPEILQKYSNQRVEYKEEVITNILNFGLAKLNAIGTEDVDYVKLYLRKLKGLYIYTNEIKKTKLLHRFNDGPLVYLGGDEISMSDKWLCVFPQTVDRKESDKYLSLYRVELNAKGFVHCYGEGEFVLMDQYNLGNILDSSLLEMYEELIIDPNNPQIRDILFSTAIHNFKKIYPKRK